MQIKLTKPLATVVTALMLISCFVTLYNIELASTAPCYTVVFTETGLPGGTNWSVTFDGETQSDTASSIIFEGYGFTQYSYTINSASGYTPTPSSGQVTPANTDPVYISVTYSNAGYTLVLSATPGGTTSPAPGIHYYSANGDLNIVATPDADHYFAGWTIDGVYFAGLSNVINGQIDRNYNLEACFAENPYTLTVVTNGQGTVTPGNSTYNGQTVELKATPAEGWSFQGWSGETTGTTDTTSITMNCSKTVTATFTENTYALTVETVGQGTVNQCNQTVPLGTTLDLAATPAQGWTFAGWTGDVTGITDKTITINGNKTVTATFTQNTYTLTVETIGQGTVTPGNQTVPTGTTITLTATPADGWNFAGWSGDTTATAATTTITMNSDKTVTATFAPNSYTLTVITVGNGTVTPNNQTYTYGEIVNLTATAAPGWRFSGWTGDITATSNSITIQMNTDKTVTATFTPSPVQIVDGNITYVECSELTVTRIPNRWDPEFYSDIAFNCTVTGPSGTSGHCRIAIPIAMLTNAARGTVAQNIYLYIDNVRYNLDFNRGVTYDSTNYYFTFYIHFSTHDICVEFREPEPTPIPTPTETPAPTDSPAPTETPTPTATPTTTSTPTTTPRPTATPTVTPTATPTSTPAPTTQPTATLKPTATSDLTLPIAGAVALLAVVLVGLVAKSRKRRW